MKDNQSDELIDIILKKSYAKATKNKAAEEALENEYKTNILGIKNNNKK